MSELTKRLQLLLTQEQYRKLKAYAAKHKRSIGAVIRDSITRTLSERSKSEKMKALERLLSRSAPVGDWEEMEQEIMRGHIKD